MEKILKAAVIGCGQIASRYDQDPKRKYPASHMGAYAVCKGVKVVAVCDTNKKNLADCAKLWKIKKVCTSIDRLLAQEKIDILSVCTPASTHRRIIEKAAKHSGLKAIFCEKPIADTLADARKIVKVCKDNGIILQIGHQRRFDSLHQKIREMLANRKFGKPQQVSFYYTHGINNFGSHMLDLLRYFFGDVKWAQGNLSINKSLKPQDPNIDGMIKFSSGLTATVQACDPRKYLLFEMDCRLEKGRIVLRNCGMNADFYGVATSRHFSGFKELVPIRNSLAKAFKPDFMVKSVEHLVECIRKGKRSISSGQDGLRALEIIKAIEKSASKGGVRVEISK